MADTIKIGNLDISAFKVGSDDCKVYLGTELLYSGGTTPTGYTYSVTITGLENGDTTDIVWDGGGYVDYGVGNGIYTYSSQSDLILVEVLNYSQDYQVSGAIVLSPSNPSGTITFIYQGGGGGGFTHIPQGADMSQYYNQTITRFKIGDSSFPSGYQTVNLNFQNGGSGNIGTWGPNFYFDGTWVNSLPCDVSGSDTLTSWTCFNSIWQSTTENPFTDLWIEFA
jgi:hypothetical protein